MLLKIILGCALVAIVSAGISDSCIDCIGQVEGGGSGCNWDVGSLSCGKYQIKENYWIDCGRPGTSWKSCATTDWCSRECITNYMKKYDSVCASDRKKEISKLTCYEFGRLHNGGPTGCSKSSTLSYVAAMKRYC